MVPCETSIIAEQDAVVLLIKQVTMETGKPCKNPLYFGFNYWPPFFIAQKWLASQNDQKLSAKKFKKILQNGFRAALNFQFFNWICSVVFFFKLCRKLASFWYADYISEIKNVLGVTEFVFEIWAAKVKIWGVFAGLSCCHSNFLLHENNQIFFSSN